MTFWIITYLVRTFICWKWVQIATISESLQKNVKDLIKLELNEQFDQDKHNWFVTLLAPQGKHTPGLFKVEFKCDKMIGLCS